jgi:hypothetical protein
VRRFGVFTLEILVSLVLNLTASLFNKPQATLLSKWGWLVVLLHATYLLASSKAAKRIAVGVRSQFGDYRMLSFAFIALCSAGLGVLYWAGINTAYSRLFSALSRGSDVSPESAPSFPAVKLQLTQQPYLVSPVAKGDDYLLVPNLIVTNSEQGRSVSLDLFVIVGNQKLETVNIPIEEWKKLQDSNDVSGQPQLKFPLNLAPLESKAGYVALRATSGLRNLVTNSQLSVPPRAIGRISDTSDSDVWIFELFELHTGTRQQSQFPMSGLTKHVSVTSVPPSLKTKTEPPILPDLFKSGFPNTLRVEGKTWSLMSNNAPLLSGPTKIYLDFDARTKFIAFYIPRSEHSYEAASGLWANVQGVFAGTEKNIGVQAGYHQNLTDIKDLTFSGRVFLYHEDNFSLRQLADLIDIYKSHGMALDFRGPEFLGDQVVAWYHEHGVKGAK